jgi:Ca-activated chloride channel homolog
MLALAAPGAFPAALAQEADMGGGGGAPVDLELVLTVDGSASVSGGVLEFQLRGHAAALKDQRVADALGSGPHGAVAMTLLLYAGPGDAQVLVPWTRLSGAGEAADFADRILAASRPVRDGSTALGGAILAALPLFEGNGFEGTRRVVDLVSNGFSNSGPPVETARDAAAEEGVTVNGLAILDEFDWLEAYFAESVIGGPGAFVRTAETRASFAEAILFKMIDEIVRGRDPGGRAVAAAEAGTLEAVAAYRAED